MCCLQPCKRYCIHLIVIITNILEAPLEYILVVQIFLQGGSDGKHATSMKGNEELNAMQFFSVILTGCRNSPSRPQHESVAG
jgi:hypothetical protein